MLKRPNKNTDYLFEAITKKHKAPRTSENLYDPIEWSLFLEAIPNLIKDLQEMTKTHVEKFYPNEY